MKKLLAKKHVAFIITLMMFSGSINAQWTVNGTNIFNSNTGNVGIGTSTPGTRLHLSSTVSGEIAKFNGGASSMYMGFYENGLYRGYIGSYSGNNEDIDFGTGGGTTGKLHLTIQASPKLTIDNSGRVGIGTATPGFLLDVAGRMRMRSGNGTAGTWLMNGANTADAAFVGMLNDNYVGMYGSGGWGFLMNTSSGNVGIGMATPAYKLDVCGTIRAKELRVETGWCDYVFAPNYKLPSLSAVESFIKKNRHLPDVTPGPQIEKDGLELAKVSSQMIRKIEELTLYVIELQKQVDTIKKAKSKN